MKNKELPNFKGKCLSISIIDDTYNHDLLNPYLEYQGDRLFIIGTVPKNATDSNWSKDKTAAIAWDRVTEYVIFDGFKDYQKSTKKSEDYEKKNSKK